MLFNWKFPFTEEYKEWIVVIENAHEESSADFEENTATFVEARSLRECTFSIQVGNFRWGMKKCFILHMHKRLQIESTYHN